MIKCLLWMAIGYAIAWVTICFISVRKDEKENEIEFVQPPLFYKEEKNVITVTAETGKYWFGDESSELIQSDLKRGLADEIWKYAMVHSTKDLANNTIRFKAALQVVDHGELNPFCGERRDNERKAD